MRADTYNLESDRPCVEGRPTMVLESFDRTDCATLVRWLDTRERLIMTAPDWSYPLTAADVEHAYFESAAGVEVYRAVSNGRMVGHFGLRVSGGASGHLFHVVVDPCLQGRGYGSAMMAALLQMSFAERGLHRLSLSVFDSNVAAIACYLRAGFRVEGHHRETSCHRDRWLSHYSMALLQREWDSHRQSDRKITGSSI